LVINDKVQRRHFESNKWQVRTAKEPTSMGNGGIVMLERSIDPLGNIQTH